MSRADILLSGLTKRDKIIEVGPSHSPLAPKSEGWHSLVVDHDTRDNLMAKYGAMGVDPQKIEEVDFVWKSGAILDALPENHHGSFKAFVASHVIEHSTDVVRFLLSAQRLIEADGTIVLAIPDKRKTFDFFRPISTTSQAITAFKERRTKHTAGTHFDNAAFSVNRGSDAGWLDTDSRESRFASDLAGAVAHWEKASSNEYVDAHAWVFTPASFELLVIELSELGYLDLRLDRRQENPTTEFYAWLKRGRIDSDQVQTRRLELMNEIVVELAEQSRQIRNTLG
jgi:hypothetical protein